MSDDAKHICTNNIEQSEVATTNICTNNEIVKLYSKTSGNNKMLLESEDKNRQQLEQHPNEHEYLYPTLDDPNFIIKIAQKKEFADTKYDGTIYNVESYADILNNADYELLAQQVFVRNFLSFQTPYNSLLLFHGLGSGKTCSAIGVCEEMRDYLKQMGISKKIIIVASPNVQDNFKLQLFDERKLKQVGGIWTMKGCLGNKLLKEINPTGMVGLKQEQVIYQIKHLISAAYSFQGYVQFSNEIVKHSGNENDSVDIKIKLLQNAYANSLIVIDEVHNIRISDDNANKNVAKNLMYLASVVSNMRLLLLSATPMFNSYKEIIWLVNLMNMNDHRGIISIHDIFDANGEFKMNAAGQNIGKELLVKKATGYISYVRGENPYTFPFRVYPDRFAPIHTFKNIDEYPIYQLNGAKIPNNSKPNKISLYLTTIGSYQAMGYKSIIDRLRNRGSIVKFTKDGKQYTTRSFLDMKAFGYIDLQLPIEALNIVYPYPELEEIVSHIKPFKYIDVEAEPNVELSASTAVKHTEILNDINDVLSQGPKLSISNNVAGPKLSSQEEYVGNNVEAIAVDGSLNVQPDKDTNNISATTTDVIQIPASDSSSFRNTLRVNKDATPIGKHLIEGSTVSDILSIAPSSKAPSSKASSKGGGNSEDASSVSSVSSASQIIHIDPRELTGTQGLKRVMTFIDSKTPSFKGNFEYKSPTSRIFNVDEIGKYSAKIKNICENIYNTKTGVVAEGIILIYSAYIDGGLIPTALALEEMGFSRYGDKKSLFKTPPVAKVDVHTMKPRTKNSTNFSAAKYAMITGDSRLSPNNDLEMKRITHDNNLHGENVKVILISQAGSEGLDFKFIRQVHILEPWYNINRLEQIIGRAVRNFSHKDLSFSKRNVEIFLYGTILDNSKEEAADLYVYRLAEQKAIKIGKVSRLLKQTAVDCLINHDQTQLTTENFKLLEENKNIIQILSDHQELGNFSIGDVDNSATCDFMTCKFKCVPDINIDDSLLNNDTYNEVFMLVNSDKIINKIKNLMKMQYFYKKKELLFLINTPKTYPRSQIYSALTQIIEDESEYIIDKYGRTGRLINIGEYYLFQPSELNNQHISVYDRSVPIDYKHNSINFQIKDKDELPGVIIDKQTMFDNDTSNIQTPNALPGKVVLQDIFEKYNVAYTTNTLLRGSDNWYEYCGIVMRKMALETTIIRAETDQARLAILEELMIHHIVDTITVNSVIDLLNYFNSNTTEPDNSSPIFIRFVNKAKQYLYSKFIKTKNITAILLFNGPSRISNVVIYILSDDGWVEAKAEDKVNLRPELIKFILDKKSLSKQENKYVGFIGFDSKTKQLVYKIKDITNPRSTGFRCGQAGKEKILSILNEIEGKGNTTNRGINENATELCVRQELTLRAFEHQSRNDELWFVSTSMAISNEFEKKEKPI